ncbi:hypothetical protein [Streptomyces sp. NPDC049915]|uniref:hypothetical protein n=1 Tax=Streptomyces sp. NPDC049915 TaxID=3155510 RepID=UPI0034124F78
MPQVVRFCRWGWMSQLRSVDGVPCGWVISRMYTALSGDVVGLDVLGSREKIVDDLGHDADGVEAAGGVGAQAPKDACEILGELGIGIPRVRRRGIGGLPAHSTALAHVTLSPVPLVVPHARRGAGFLIAPFPEQP